MLCHLLRRCDELIADLPLGTIHSAQGPEILIEPSMPGSRRKGATSRRGDSQSASRCSPTTLSHDENRKLAKHLYAEKEACSPSSHTTVDATTGGRAGDPPGGREPQVWAEGLRGAPPSKDDELIRTGPAELDVIEFSTLAGTHAEEYRRFRVERPLRSSFIRWAE